MGLSFFGRIATSQGTLLRRSKWIAKALCVKRLWSKVKKPIHMSWVDLISFPQIHQDIYIWRGTQLRFSSVDVLTLFPLSWVGLEYAIMIEWQTEILWSSSSSVLIGFEQTNRDPCSHRMALNLTTQPQTVRMGLEWHKATVHDRHLKTISLITAFSSDYDIIFSCPTCKAFWPITALRLRERRGISRCYWTYPWIIRS